MKLILTLIFCLSTIFAFSQNNSELLNESELLKEIFTVNIGIMEFKQIGKVNSVNPVVRQTIENSVKNTLDSLRFISLTPKQALVRAFSVFESKQTTGLSLSQLDLKQVLEFTGLTNIARNTQQILNEFKTSSTFYDISKRWFELYTAPIYRPVVSKPFARVINPLDQVCSTQSPKLDLLFYGEVENIGTGVYVNIFVYSALDKSTIYSFSFMSGTEEINKNTVINLEKHLSRIFNINYGSLNISVEDGVMVFINNRYEGKGDLTIKYLPPGAYNITSKKENYEDRNDVVIISDNTESTLDIVMEAPVEMQDVNFNIEPYGTKIFINAKFYGRTPFKTSLPQGDYIIFAENELYNSLRYFLTIEKPDNMKKSYTEEKNIVFHLSSRNFDKMIKRKHTAYYALFWTATFSLAATIPSILFAKEIFYSFGAANALWNKNNPNLLFVRTDAGLNYYIAMNIVYGLAAFNIGVTVLLFGWMFYSLADYLITLEKKDFIPILEFYQNENGDSSLNVGARIKL